MRICPKCGKQAKDEINFCPNCGNKLQSQNNLNDDNDEKGFKMIYIAILVLVILLGFFACSISQSRMYTQQYEIRFVE